jgi:hypothetical protein
LYLFWFSFTFNSIFNLKPISSLTQFDLLLYPLFKTTLLLISLLSLMGIVCSSQLTKLVASLMLLVLSLEITKKKNPSFQCMQLPPIFVHFKNHI